MIRAVVLAAGESRRMGMPKPLLRFGNTTFLEHIVAVLRQSDINPITVVLGSRAERVRASTHLSGVDVVINGQYQEGQLSSLIAGLQDDASSPTVAAMLLCLVDHPLITPQVVTQVVRAFRETGKPIVIPVFNGRRGHPALFARSLFAQLIDAPADKGARYVVGANADHVLEVPVTEPGVLVSIDTPSDYVLHFGVEPRVISRSRFGEGL